MSDGLMTEIRPAPDDASELLTVGVEEEFLLVDPATGIAVPAVDAVLAEVPPELRGQVQHEFQTSQIEIGTPPGIELHAVRHSLGLLRSELSDAAERAGARLLAVGTGPVAGVDHHLLVAAHWRAVHDGLEGMAVDVAGGATRSAWHVMRRLFDRVSPELARHDDLPLVTALMGRLRSRGTGAARQRAVHARTGELLDVVDYLAAHTRG